MRKRIVTFVALVLAGVCLLMVFEPQHPQAVFAQAATGTIAYVVPNDTSGDQVWLIEPNGSNNRKIYSIDKSDTYHVQAISSLVWRPDAGELVFASDHEEACSWYGSDLYAIQPDGSGYRRVTNGPACAALASYPKGSVTMNAGYGGGLYQVYVMGASEPQSTSGGPITIDNVADLGNTVQPIVAIDGNYRWLGPAIDVKAGQPVDAGNLTLYTDGGDQIGAFRPAWRRDGSRIGYAFGCANLYGIADQPPAGSSGQALLNATGVTPCIMAWGSTATTASQIVFFTPTPMEKPGFYLTTENSSNPPTYIIQTADYDHVFGLQYLPDGSGIILGITDNFGDSSNIYRYNFATDSATRLTNFTNEYARDFSISPDGQTIVFERAQQQSMYLYGGPSDLWKMGINGSNMQFLVANGAHPSWSQTAIKVPQKVFIPLVRR